VWTPRFACPQCGVEIAGDNGSVFCLRCGRRYEERDGIWRFLTPARSAALEPFVAQYRTVRSQDGHRRASADYCRALPSVDAGDPQAGEWRIRRETYRNLLRHVFAEAPQSIRVLDVGAGNGWLSHRLTELGHLAVAVDAQDDDGDGLGAKKHYHVSFPAVQAHFDELPFAREQFDVVVFNGSLHYARDAAATLARANGQLAAGGILVVMDSPMFHADAAGHAMMADQVRRFRFEYGVADFVHPGAGYLTFASLAATADLLRLAATFIPSRGSFGWRMRRRLARLRLRRAPAAFGLWVAR
jgi:SAM-dependent methyltransferase